MGLLSAPACALEASAPLIYVYPEDPVVSRLNASGEQYRPIQLLADEMFRLADVEWENLPVPVFRMYQYLNSGRANLSILIKMPRLQQCCITSELPVYQMELGIYHLPNVQPVAYLNDLVGRSIITIDTYGFGSIGPFLNDPDNQISILAAHSHDSAFSMLEAGRADFFLDYLGPAKKVYDEKQKNDIRYHVLRRFELYVVLRKDYPDAQNVANYLGEIYRTLDERDITP